MKKTMKKLVAVATTAVMTFAMGISAYAVNIVTLAGSMNEWAEADMDAKLTDEDGDGIWTYTTKLAAGDYSFKMIIDGAWTPDGMSNNYGITVAADTDVTFCYNPNSTDTYPYTAIGTGVTVNTDCNRADAEGEGKDPEEIKAKLEASAADAAKWAPAAPAAPAAEEESTEAPEETKATQPEVTDKKDTTPATGDALSLSIVMVGAVAVVAFVASRKKANA